MVVHSPLSLWERVPEGRERADAERGLRWQRMLNQRPRALHIGPHPPFGHLPPEGEGWSTS